MTGGGEDPSPLILAWGWAVFALAVGTCFLFASHIGREAPLPEFVRTPVYVVQALALGWYCPDPDCGVWNGDGKEFRRTCRACECPRPKVYL